MTKAHEYAEKVASIVKERGDNHGVDKETSFDLIAAFWEAYMKGKQQFHGGRSFNGKDVANLMVLLKIARSISGQYNEDDFVDMAGYAVCAAEIASVQESRLHKLDFGELELQQARAGFDTTLMQTTGPLPQEAAVFGPVDDE